MADIIMAEKSYTIQNQMVSLQRHVGNLQNQITKDKKAYQLLETDVDKLDTLILSLEENILIMHAKRERIMNTKYPVEMIAHILNKYTTTFSVEKEKYLLDKMYDEREQKKREMLLLTKQMDSNRQQIAVLQSPKQTYQLQLFTAAQAMIESQFNINGKEDSDFHELFKN